MRQLHRFVFILLLCPLLMACTVGIIQQEEIVQDTPSAIASGAAASSTPTPDSAAQATLAALQTQNAVLATQVAVLEQTDTPTPSPTATPTKVAAPAAAPTQVPTATPTPCAIALGAAFQPRLSDRHEAASALGCAITAQQQIWTAEQVFQHGRMLWKEDRDEAFILYNDDGTYQLEDDPYIEGDPEDACPEVGGAPEGLFKPVRGFNRQWCNAPGVRDKLGWALEKEAGHDATWQTFEQGLVLLNRANHIFVLYKDGTWEYVE